MPFVPSRSRKWLTAVPVLLLGTWGFGSDCDGVALGPWFDADETSVTVSVGEEKTLAITSNGFIEVDPESCKGNAQLTYDIRSLRVRGTAPGQCTAKLHSTKDDDKATLDVRVTVVAAADGGPPDAATTLPDASTEAGPTPICSVPMGKVGTIGDRDLYMAFTDVDSGEQNQACPIHTSTDYKGDVTFNFLAGSPGYRIDGRGNYVILSASPATLENAEFTSSAVALEGNIITMTFQKRLFDDQDASAPRPIWTMTFRLAPDPDPAKWKVELFSFSKP